MNQQKGVLLWGDPGIACFLVVGGLTAIEAAELGAFHPADFLRFACETSQTIGVFLKGTMLGAGQNRSPILRSSPFVALKSAPYGSQDFDPAGVASEDMILLQVGLRVGPRIRRTLSKRALELPNIGRCGMVYPFHSGLLFAGKPKEDNTSGVRTF